VTTLTKIELREVWDRDRKKERIRLASVIAVTVMIFLLCLCFRFNAYAYDDKLVPLEYLRSYILAIRLTLSRLTGGELWLRRDEMIAAADSVIYYGALAQLRTILMSFAAGAGTALSGVIFQTAYRNPMASPNIIGATAGVGLGNVVVIMLFSAQALENVLQRYIYCYGFTVICVGLVMLLGRVTGARRKDGGDIAHGGAVVTMIMAGSVVSQLLRVFTQYFRFNLSDTDLIVFEQMTLGVNMRSDVTSMSIFLGVTLCAVIPILLMRYRLNALALTDTESAAIGISGGAPRLISQICGVLMVTSSMIHYGMVGMVSMVIPYLLRRKIGSAFGKLSIYSIFISGCLLMLCRVASSLAAIEGSPLPAALVVELLLMPVFFAISISRKKAAANEA
jgi:iron complex transport system permease protein